MAEFNNQWARLCDLGGDEFDEAEPFQDLLDVADSFATASNQWEFDGGPGSCSGYIAFYVAPHLSTEKIKKSFQEAFEEDASDLQKLNTEVVPIEAPIKRKKPSEKVHTRHHLYHGELSDMPGRDEIFDEYLTYLGNGRWKLESDGTDFSGLQSAESMSQSFCTKDMINWVLDRDYDDRSEDGLDTEEDSKDYPNVMGPRMQRLYEIAKSESANYCVKCIERWQLDIWPPIKKTPAIKVVEIKGVTLRGVWIRSFKACFDIVTNLGPAFLHPPDNDGNATVLLKSASSMSPGKSIKLNKLLLAKIDELMPQLEELKKNQGVH